MIAVSDISLCFHIAAARAPPYISIRPWTERSAHYYNKGQVHLLCSARSESLSPPTGNSTEIRARPWLDEDEAARGENNNIIPA